MGSFLCYLTNSNSHLQEYIRKSIFLFFPKVMALTCTSPGPDSLLHHFSIISGTPFIVQQLCEPEVPSVTVKAKV